MRRFLLIVAMVMFALPTFAQNYEMRLISIASNDGFEAYDYVYPNETSTSITCVNKNDFTTDTESIDSLFYDERGNITRLATWQNINGQWIYACYVDYTYNDQNLRISRSNYNDFHDGYGFQLGGIFRYNYDEEGRMTEWALEFMDVEEYQKAMIEYDENGLKTVETMLQYNFATYSLENAFMTEYEYDNKGNCTKEAEFSYDINSGNWTPNPYRIYEYDEFDNCILMEHRTIAGTVQERRVYNYDPAILAEKVFYYPNPEQDYPQLPEAKTNLLKSFEYFAQNDNNELMPVTTYIMGYETGEYVGESVEEVEFASNVYPNPAQDYVMVESSEADYVEVVDVFGRVVFASEMNETVRVDMSNLTTGIYFVKLQANGATSVQKIVKK